MPLRRVLANYGGVGHELPYKLADAGKEEVLAGMCKGLPTGSEQANR